MSLIQSTISAVQFAYLSSQEVRAISARHITESNALDQLNRPLPGGTVDPAMGANPYSRQEICPTCGHDAYFCIGHPGHVELSVPVYNPVNMEYLYKLLKATCLNCHRLRLTIPALDSFYLRLALLKTDQSRYAQFLDLIETGDPAAYLAKLDAKSEAQKAWKQDLLRKSKTKKARIQLLERLVATFEAEVVDVSLLGHNTPKLDNNYLQRQINNLLLRELWLQVVPSKCPHCKTTPYKIKKEGWTKFLRMPLKDDKNRPLIYKNEYFTSDDESEEREDETRMPLTATMIESEQEAEGLTEDQTAMSALPGADNLKLAKGISGREESDEEQQENKAGVIGSRVVIHALEVREHIELLWDGEDGALLNLMYGRVRVERNRVKVESIGPSAFFLQMITVTPNRFRPANKVGEENYVHQQTVDVKKIIMLNKEVKKIFQPSIEEQKKPKGEALIQKWVELQDAVNSYIDPSRSIREKDKTGLKQLLERKEGLFRMKMMGKRVNFAARSVISADPFLRTCEIGVPLFVAQTLTFPEPVTALNREILRQYILNGPHEHPGANMIENLHTGSKIYLQGSREHREQSASILDRGVQCIVYRHLQDGDLLLVNRQPTLHKPSIMAHKAKILSRENVFRLHYANCSAYNADFDGDEMNIHFCQTYMSRAEKELLALNDRNYTVPTSGRPIRGLIQDHVVSAVYLCLKDTFLNKAQFTQYVYEALANQEVGGIVLEPPCVMKPRQLWSGKQVITALIKTIARRGSEKEAGRGLCMEGKTKVEGKLWSIAAEEAKVIVRQNVLLTGVLDKSQIGAADFGLVHCFYELYGPEKTGMLQSALSALLTFFLRDYGFSMGLDACILSKGGEIKRRRLIEKAHQDVIKEIASKLGVSLSYLSENLSNRVHFQMKQSQNYSPELEELNKEILPKKLFKKEVEAGRGGLADTLRSKLQDLEGAQGDQFYANVTLQQRLEALAKATGSQGTTEIVKSGKQNTWLPFPKNRLATMVVTGAKGGEVNQSQISSMLGQQELEGKRVPLMSSGKSLPSFPAYEANPRAAGYISDRFLTGVRAQDFYFHCMAGREGLVDTAVKTSRSGYLQRCLVKALETCVVAYDYSVRDSGDSVVQFLYGQDAIDVASCKFLQKFDFLHENKETYEEGVKAYYNNLDKEAKKVWQKEKKQARKDYEKKTQDLSLISKEPMITSSTSSIADPAIAVLNPARCAGVVSQKYEKQFQKYTKSSKHFRNSDSLSQASMRYLAYYKYFKCLINPGQNVGTIAAQSIGQPSTQMTLNTFHLAGHGAGVNVTLGIPRLREILMTANNNIKTPTMTLPLLVPATLDSAQQRFIARNLAHKFKRVTLRDVAQKLEVESQLAKSGSLKVWEYRVVLYFEAGVDNIEKILRERFLVVLLKMVEKEKKLLGIAKTVQMIATQREETQAGETAKVVKEQEEEEKKEDAGEEEGLDQEQEEGFQEEELDQKLKETLRLDNLEDIIKFTEKTEKKEASALEGGEFKGNAFHFTVRVGVRGRKKILIRRLVERALEQTPVQQLPGIKDSFVVEQKNSEGERELAVQTDGVNFGILWHFADQIQLNRVSSTDLDATLKFYGVGGLKFIFQIEACRAAVVRQIQGVFGHYGINVDRRHLSLVADFLTQNGTYRPFNRVGMHESTSPLQKMSFETSGQYLAQAALFRESDTSNSASANIVLGQPAKVGTGYFDLLMAPAP